jgi:hypothetical protein
MATLNDYPGGCLPDGLSEMPRIQKAINLIKYPGPSRCLTRSIIGLAAAGLT